MDVKMMIDFICDSYKINPNKAMNSYCQFKNMFQDKF